jgi:hypothetical protein
MTGSYTEKSMRQIRPRIVVKKNRFDVRNRTIRAKVAFDQRNWYTVKKVAFSRPPGCQKTNFPWPGII